LEHRSQANPAQDSRRCTKLCAVKQSNDNRRKSEGSDQTRTR
jgi:hypothetical protein